MISFQEAVQKHIDEAEEELGFYEYCLWDCIKECLEGSNQFTDVLAQCMYYDDLLEALKGVERLEPCAH